MKATCVVQCQKDRKHLYEVGKEYEITDEMFKSGYWKKAEKKEAKETK